MNALYRSLTLTLAVIAASCASQQKPQPSGPTMAENTAKPQTKAALPSQQRELLVPYGYSGKIARSELNTVLDEGIGRFLQNIVTQANVKQGQFAGFKILALHPTSSLHKDLDLKEGDVVTRINGQSVKTPDDAIKVWQELRVASELRIDYERNGVPATLRYLITND